MPKNSLIRTFSSFGLFSCDVWFRRLQIKVFDCNRVVTRLFTLIHIQSLDSRSLRQLLGSSKFLAFEIFEMIILRGSSWSPEKR